MLQAHSCPESFNLHTEEQLFPGTWVESCTGKLLGCSPLNLVLLLNCRDQEISVQAQELLVGQGVAMADGRVGFLSAWTCCLPLLSSCGMAREAAKAVQQAVL